ncbi:hypothetical protein ACNKHN_16660 [Shigella flexneri]
MIRKNAGVIAETLTQHGTRYCMAQNYLPAIKDGDERVLVVDGGHGRVLPGAYSAGGRNPWQMWAAVVTVNLVR